MSDIVKIVRKRFMIKKKYHQDCKHDKTPVIHTNYYIS